MTDREKPLVEQLEEALREFEQAVRVLDVAYKRAIAIDLTTPNEDEQMVLEAFTARFARASDVFLQRILRTVDLLELIERDTLIDALNRAEKRGLISSSAIFRDIRALRNDIAHKYALDDIHSLHEQTLSTAPHLIASFGPTAEYARQLIAKLC